MVAYQLLVAVLWQLKCQHCFDAGLIRISLFHETCHYFDSCHHWEYAESWRADNSPLSALDVDFKGFTSNASRKTVERFFVEIRGRTAFPAASHVNIVRTKSLHVLSLWRTNGLPTKWNVRKPQPLSAARPTSTPEQLRASPVGSRKATPAGRSANNTTTFLPTATACTLQRELASIGASKGGQPDRRCQVRCDVFRSWRRKIHLR